MNIHNVHSDSDLRKVNSTIETTTGKVVYVETEIHTQDVLSREVNDHFRHKNINSKTANNQTLMMEY